RAPGVVAAGIASPSLILVAWAVGGAVTLLAAMPLMEAGASVPVAGGYYPIAKRAFGGLTGFLAGWLVWLQTVAASAFISVVFGEYIHRLGFAGQLSNSVLAAGLLVVVGAGNLIGTKVSGGSQTVGSAVKLVAFLVLAALLFASPRGAPVHGPTTAGLALGGVGAFVMAVRVIYQTYGGWDGAIYFSEEVHRPGRNVVRATLGGIVAVTLIYVLVNAAVLHVLDVKAIAGSALAVGDAARVSLGSIGDAAITGMGLFSLAAVVNIQVMEAPRITFAMARDGVLPRPLAAVTRGGAPWIGVIMATGASILFAATGSYESLVRIYAPWAVAALLIICLASIRLRVAEPDLPRPWMMPLFPWLAIAVALIQIALISVMIWDDPAAGAWSAAAAAAPLPIYLFLIRRRRPATAPL
ncbi:MAG: amino acid permease, partial [Caulobacteraceae bacterium]